MTYLLDVSNSEYRTTSCFVTFTERNLLGRVLEDGRGDEVRDALLQLRVIQRLGVLLEGALELKVPFEAVELKLPAPLVQED